MIVTLHMCGPEGEALRQQLANTLNTLKRDNRYVINAMLNSGMDVPDTVIEADLNYVPSRHEWDPHTRQPTQVFYGMKAMMDSGEFSCADAAAFEAAVQEEKYGVPTEVICVPTSSVDNLHGIYVTPQAVVDPTENWLRYWETMLGLGGHPPDSMPKPQQQKLLSSIQTAQKLGASCKVVDGRVNCDVEDDAACCVDLDRKVWRCPDPELNGKPVQIAEVFQGEKGHVWARTEEGVFVPVCRSPQANPSPIRERKRRGRTGRRTTRRRGRGYRWAA